MSHPLDDVMLHVRDASAAADASQPPHRCRLHGMLVWAVRSCAADLCGCSGTDSRPQPDTCHDYLVGLVLAMLIDTLDDIADPHVACQLSAYLYDALDHLLVHVCSPTA
jgi:hypothetical protein